jgi:hypothetical protein
MSERKSTSCSERSEKSSSGSVRQIAILAPFLIAPARATIT